ncbi:MAG: PQQ-binding-like beta-propeller repeat protein [Phycisphaerales bacterium]
MRAAIPTLLVAASAAFAQEWTHYAATPERNAVATVPALPDLDAPAWTFDADGGFEAIHQASPVISDAGDVIVLGWIGPDAFAFALEASTGRERWRAPIAPPQLLSWSSPAVAAGLVAVASGTEVVGLDPTTGDRLWTAPLGQPIVNASPAIVGQPPVVLITTFGPGGNARLLSIDAASGDVLHDQPAGPLSGATPAVADGVAYLGDTDGFVHAYGPGLSPLWTLAEPLGQGFFGSPSVDDGAVFVATYGFSGGRSNSTLARLDATTGDRAWTTPAARTDAAPIVLPDGRVVLSGGIDGFGSLSTVQLFEADGSRLWDLVDATWVDANANGMVDPGEYLSLGGWDHQPAALVTDDGDFLLVGAPSGGLSLLDLSRDPADALFVRSSTPLGGGSPAIARGVAVSAWGDAVVAFAYGEVCFADFDGDGSLTLFDFLAFQNAFDAGERSADCDGDGSLTLFDFLCFQNAFDAGCG